MTERKALLAGATGLVGDHLLHLLLASRAYDRVTTLARRPLDVEHQKLDARIVDFDDLAGMKDPPEIDDTFCCLGTTIKTAGSKAAFRKVDHDYVEAVARLGHAHGARQFLLVSAIGARADSANFYSRVKGEAEETVSALPYRSLHIFRPSILMGKRQENRPGERLGIAAARLLNPLLAGPLLPYRGILPETVAAAMINAAKLGPAGPHVYTYGEMWRLVTGV